MPLTKFGWVDVLFVTLLFRICYIGFKNGLFTEFLRLLGLFSAFILSFNNYTIMSRFLSLYTKWQGVSLDFISFCFIFIGILLIFKLIALMVNLFSNKENVSLPNRLIGLLFGFGRALLLISLIYTLLINSTLDYLSRSAREKSFLSRYITGIAAKTYSIGINLYPGDRIDTPLAKLLTN